MEKEIWYSFLASSLPVKYGGRCGEGSSSFLSPRRFFAKRRNPKKIRIGAVK
jgi:hypothetical protein